jgi:hypothetical protein
MMQDHNIINFEFQMPLNDVYEAGFAFKVIYMDAKASVLAHVITHEAAQQLAELDAINRAYHIKQKSLATVPEKIMNARFEGFVFRYLLPWENPK